MSGKRWEYLTSNDRAQMGHFGEQGWELVSVCHPGGVETFYYKRPYPSIREQITLSQRESVLRDKGGSKS